MEDLPEIGEVLAGIDLGFKSGKDDFTDDLLGEVLGNFGALGTRLCS